MKVGSMVICVSGGIWYDIDTNEDGDGPHIGETLIVSGFQQDDYLEFEEYPELQYDGLPSAYHKRHFLEIQPPLNIDIESLIHQTILT